MPDSHFMFHDGTFVFSGTVKQALTEAVQLKVSCDRMMEIYLDSCEDSEAFGHLERAQIKKKLRNHMDRKEEVYLTAEETVAWGFADMVFGGDDKYDWKSLRA